MRDTVATWRQSVAGIRPDSPAPSIATAVWATVLTARSPAYVANADSFTVELLSGEQVAPLLTVVPAKSSQPSTTLRETRRGTRRPTRLFGMMSCPHAGLNVGDREVASARAARLVCSRTSLAPYRRIPDG
jgi:hypothetical protein